MEVDRFTHDGVDVRILLDDFAEHADPREHDNVSTLLCWHPDYVLGDEQFVAPNGRGALATRARESQRDAEARLSPLRPVSMEHLRRYLTLCRNAVGVSPLYLLDHSGLHLSVGSASYADPGGWDTTMIGYAYTTHARLTELCGDEPEYHTDEWIDNAIRLEVEEYRAWLGGEVYGYVVADGDDDEESCFGFIGHESVAEEARMTAGVIAKDRADRQRERTARMRTLAANRGRVTA